ncbi:MAG: GC-type dockerin domain-anchored protein [Phycisphaerales bacterium JB037]
MNLKLALVAIAGLAAAASGQVVINEVYENPPGGGIDDFYEYIELYGKPGMSLDGFTVALLKGGTTDVVECDESFSLDGLSLGANGLLILYNDRSGGTLLPAFDPDTTFATFTTTFHPTTDPQGAGGLANDDSSTYVLLRARPAGTAPFPTDWRKEAEHDINLDGLIDFPFENPNWNLEPYQMVDDVAWSNNMGREYTREDTDEIDDTPGFNPDSITRMRYYGGAGPIPGSRGPEEWIIGDVTNLITHDYDTLEVGFPSTVIGTGARLTPGAFNDFGSDTQFRFITGDANFDGVVDAADLTIAQGLLGATRDDLTDCLDDMGQPIIDPMTSQPYQCYVFQGRAFNALEIVRCMDVTDGPGGGNDEAVTQSDIDAIAALVPCRADLTGSSDPNDPTYGTGDGDADGDDFFFYLDAFSTGALAVCDITGSSDPNDPSFDTPDGDCDGDDFFRYLDLFSQGCN